MSAALAVFVTAGLAIVYAGSIQARASDVLAERSGLGRLWIGSVVLAAGTSLPELATDVSAVRLGAPDLAAGDLFGSSLANMLILAAVGYLRAGAPVFSVATPTHAVAACLAIALNATAGVFVLTAREQSGWAVGGESVLLALGFLVGMRVVYAHRSDGMTPPPPGARRAGALDRSNRGPRSPFRTRHASGPRSGSRVRLVRQSDRRVERPRCHLRRHLARGAHDLAPGAGGLRRRAADRGGRSRDR